MRDLVRCARRVRLRDRCRAQAVRLALVERGRGVEDARPRALRQDDHVGEQVPDGLEAADRMAELAALRRVVAREREDASPPRRPLPRRRALRPSLPAGDVARAEGLPSDALRRDLVEPDGRRPQGRVERRLRLELDAGGVRADEREHRAVLRPAGTARRSTCRGEHDAALLSRTRRPSSVVDGSSGREAALGLPEAERGSERPSPRARVRRRGAARRVVDERDGRETRAERRGRSSASSTVPSSASTAPISSAPKSTRSCQSRLAGSPRNELARRPRASQALLVGEAEAPSSVLGQGEDAVGDDVALDLPRAAVDARGARVEVALVPEARAPASPSTSRAARPERLLGLRP